MDTNESRRRTEREIHQAVLNAGGIIPHTVEQVKVAESMIDDSEALPASLCDPQAVLKRIQSKQSDVAEKSETPHVFGALIAMLRNKRGFSLDVLAEKARVDREELEQIETNFEYEPKPRTVHQLAEVFGIAARPLVRVASLTRRSDDRIAEGAVRFAACAKNMDKLTREQKKELKRFIKLLNSIE